ncbi:hypothetical protein PARHAE_03283 [Paracoccus haematequi]|uniref:Uncharacterized protein n=1 Tax=Paracoccus haematequi TaxID=2491866 RepID=A0A447IRF5_9RHOB|nr:hypothetical protein [Paracoccus haematequi]VDS10072.1 hypothetical protein PARHAE_03283 [Paracoccus haematequi]
MSYAMMRLKYELIGLVMLVVGVGGIIGSYTLGFFNWPSAGCWILGLIPFLQGRRYSEAGVWMGTVILVVAHAVGAMCALYAFAGIFMSPLAIWELAVYAPRDPSKLGEGAFLFVFGYVLPGVVWLKLFLGWD